MNKITKSIDTVREKKLYFKENVGEDASICLQRQNNIATFEESKSNVVGADASVRPQTNKKYKNEIMSKISTFNIKPL